MLILIPLNQIADNPFQARQEYGDIQSLAADIYRHYPARPDTCGLQQPPTARLVAEDDLELVPTANLDLEDWLRAPGQLQPGYLVQLEFGHRRLRAFRHLAASDPRFYAMPVHLRDLDDDAMLNGVWSENRARRDLSAVEEAALLKVKLDRLRANGDSQAALAEAWGLARSTIANRLRLLDLPAEIQAANRDGRLSERQCLSLAPIVELRQIFARKPLGSGHLIGIRPRWPLVPVTSICAG
jgi:ParB/RepB/Spo0J family partition protein